MKKKKRKKLDLKSQTVRNLAVDTLGSIAGAVNTDDCSGNPCTVYSCLCTKLCSIRTCPP